MDKATTKATREAILKYLHKFNESYNSFTECTHPTYKDKEHCHAFDQGQCMPHIKDCEEHAKFCFDDCHDECACQDFEG